MATRIILCGASSVGKTTLANDWCRSHTHFRHIEEVARNIMEEKGIKREDLELSLSGDKKLFLDLQCWIFEKQNEVESDFERKRQNFVSDRGPDPLAFALFYATGAAEEKLATTPSALSCLKRYHGCHIVVLCPLETCTDDGVRLMSSAYKERMQFTKCLCTLLRKYQLPYVYCNVADHNERLYFLEQVIKQQYPLDVVLNQVKLFNNISFQSKKPSKPAQFRIRSIEVSSETITTGYHAEESNRMLLRYSADQFVHLQFDHRVKPDQVVSVLRGGMWINGEEFNFFGCSSRSLKTRGCFLLKGPAKTVHEVLSECGSFADINCPSKLLKRIGLLFSKCRRTDVAPFSVHCEPDIVGPGGNFTDGCGRIGMQLAADITKRLQLPLDEGYVPSVFQIRFKGCKGVLAVDPKVKPASVHLRPSMVKFKDGTKPLPDICLCDHSRPYSYGHLNRQFIMLLSGLGVKDEVFFTLQKNYHECIHQMSRNAQVAVVISHWKSRPDLAARIASVKNFLEDRYIVRQVAYLKSTLVDKMDKLSILVEESRNVFGVCDVHGVLKYGECFFRPTVAGTPKTLSGKVVVCKNPCYLLGDVRVLTAVSDSRVQKLEHLTDCIVFPTTGSRPHADEIAGSDLDGDQFFVSWHQDLVPKHIVSPYSYPSVESPPGDVSYGALVKFFAHFRSNVGQIDSCYKHWAEVEGVASRQCCQLGELFAASVDASKTGALVRIPKQLLPPRNHPRFTNKDRIWNRLLVESNKKKAQLRAAVISAEAEIVSAISEEFVTSTLQDDSLDATGYRLFRFARMWCFGQSWTSDEAIDALKRLSRNIHFGEFTLDQQVEAIDSGIPTPLVTNALNKSQILSSEMLQSFLLHREHSHWRFYFSSDQDGFEWSHMLRALERHSQSLVVMQLPNGVSVVLHFMNKLSLGERMKLTAGSASAYIFSEKFAFRERHVLGQEYSYNLSSEVLQIYRGEPNRSFLWLGQPRPKPHHKEAPLMGEDGSTCASIDLTRFRGNILQRGHPTITKQAFTLVEIFVKSENHCPAYFDVWYTEEYTSELPPANSTVVGDLAKSDTKSSVPHNTASENQPNTSALTNSQHQLTTLQDAATRGDVETFCSCFDRIISERAKDSSLPEELSAYVLMQIQVLVQVLLNNHTVQKDLPHQLYQQLLKIVAKLNERASAPSFVLYLICSLSKMYSGPLDSLVSAAVKSVQFSDIIQYLNVLKQWQSWLSLPSIALSQLAEHVASTVYALVDSSRHPQSAASKLDKAASPDKILPHYISRVGNHCLWGFAQTQSTVQPILIGSIHSVQKCMFPYFEELRTSPLDGFHKHTVSKKPGTTRQQLCDLKVEFSIAELDDVDCASYRPGQWVAVHRLPLNRTDKSGVPLPLAFGIVSHISTDSVPGKIVVDCVAPDPVFVSMVTVSIPAQELPQWQLRPTLDVLSFVRTISALRKMAEGQLTEVMSCVLLAHGFAQPPRTASPCLGHSLEDGSSPARSPPKVSSHDSASPDQCRAIEATLSRKVTLIDGLPGTGKTYTACEIAATACRLSAVDHTSHCLVVLERSSHIVNVAQNLHRKGLRVVSIDPVQDATLAVPADFSLRQQLHWKGVRPSQDVSAQREILKCAQVIVATCVGAGDPLLQGMHFACVIVDDATRISEEASLIPVALSCQTLVLIGDSHECPNTGTVSTSMPSPPWVSAVETMPGGEKAVSSLFHVLVLRIPSIFLDQQFRIPLNLANFVSSQFCDGKLRTSELVLSRSSPLKRAIFGGSSSVFFDFAGSEERVGLSYRNTAQAEAICSIVTHLLNSEVSSCEITVLTLFQAQVACIKEALLPVADKVQVATVRGYQGHENDVVVFSCVLSHTSKEPENCSKSDCDTFPGMYSTLLTRGRRLLVVVGSVNVLKQSKLWSQWLGEKMTSCEALKNLQSQRSGGQDRKKKPDFKSRKHGSKP